ncbi:hypothetical protein [Nonomuraea sp. NPDC046570]|uniref:hypothetical protein n=1 Tax=Nonomuraea sp. NPDC046570 TaxID=3155255 RepID=UPI0034032954
MQGVLLLWWAAYYPGLFSRDSVLYLSHTIVGPWVSDHSVLYDAMLWVSVKTTGDLSAVTFLQTTAMAAAITWLCESLKALGAPRRWTTAITLLLPFLPPLGAFTVTFWKDVPFTICVIALTAVCARVAARRGPRNGDLLALGALFLGLGLFRANGFLVVAIAVAVLLVVFRTRRVRLALAGLIAVGVPLALTSVVLPQAGIKPPSRTFVYHTAYGDVAVLYARRPDLFTPADLTLMASIAPLERWRKGGTCYTINTLIWRGDFNWPVSDARAGEIMELWQRLLREEPALVVEARLCRGSIAWHPLPNPEGRAGGTYHFSLRRHAAAYVGLEVVNQFPELGAYALRPLSQPLYHAADAWREVTYGKGSEAVDWLLYRGAFWCYLTYLAAALAAWSRRNRYALGIATVVAGQQLAVMANISAQDFRYMASPIFIGMMLVPLLVSSLRRKH